MLELIITLILMLSKNGAITLEQASILLEQAEMLETKQPIEIKKEEESPCVSRYWGRNFPCVRA